MIYFDNAATTLVKPRKVLTEMNKNLQLCGSFGRSGSEPSRYSADVIYGCREKICKLFGTEMSENVVFTYNATYALNLAIKSIITEKCTVLTSCFEHNSTIRPLKALEKIGVKTKIVSSPIYDHEKFLEEFKKNATNDVEFAVINHVSNSFGYILPIKEIDEICFKQGIKLILDISQSAGILPINLSEFKSVVCVCAPAHKSLYGVQGVGFALFTDETCIKKSVIEGGTGSMSSETVQPDFLPDMLESGTPNAPAIGALATGIDYVLGTKFIAEKVYELAKKFAEKMSAMPKTRVIFCANPKVQTGVVSFYHEEIDSEEIASMLNEKGVYVRAGVQCSPLSHETVGVESTIRASFSSFNTFFEINKFCEVYEKIIKQ